MDRLLGGVTIPVRERLVDPKTGLLSGVWLDYFQRLPPTLGAIPSRINAVVLDDQSGSLSATDFSNGELREGLYRLTYSVEVDSSGGGDFQLSFGWTGDGVVRTWDGAILSLGVGETQAVASETVLAHVDAASAVTYATDFSGARAYNLYVTLEKVYVL